MANPAKFLENVNLIMNDTSKLTDRQKKNLKLMASKFTEDEICKKSSACANIVKFVQTLVCYLDFVESNGVNINGLSDTQTEKN